MTMKTSKFNDILLYILYEIYKNNFQIIFFDIMITYTIV